MVPSPFPAGLLVHPGEVILLEGRFGEESGKQYNVDAMNTFADSRFLSLSVFRAGFI